MIAKGSNSLKAYVGSTEVSKIYKGNVLVYSSAPAPLPYDTEVEYLEGTGTQYINTGLYPNKNYTFDTMVAKTVANDNCVYWGVRSSGTYSTNNWQCYLNSNQSSGAYARDQRIRLLSTAITNTKNWDSGITPTVGTMYSFTGMTVVSTMNTMTYPLILFGMNNKGTMTPSLGKCRIGKFTVYSSGVKVMDMIPVRVGNVGYMYDKVGGTLFGNGGTGTFTLGADVV